MVPNTSVPRIGGSPSLHHELSAAERFVIWKGPKEGAEAFKITLLSLLARGILRRGTLSPRFPGTTVLATGQPMPAHAPEHDRVVVSAVAASKTGAMDDVLARVQRSAGSNFRKFAWDGVVPGLVARRLAIVEQRRVLGFIPAGRNFAPTADGRAAAASVEAEVQRARSLPQLLRENPAAAAALALGLGATLLLLPELREFYGQIGEAIRALQATQGSSDSSGTGSSDSAPDSSSRDEFRLDDTVLQDLGDFAATASSIDASVDSAASSSDSGSDSGGGDGGGGGGD